jgi:peptidyl-prolyl cis-trans isomerase C
MRRWPFAAIALGGLLSLRPGQTSAQQGPGPIVLRVGTTGVVVTATALQDRIAAMPPFQRATFGSTPRSVARAMLTTVIVPELLVGVAAADAGLEKTPAVALALDRARAGATIRALKASVGLPSAVSLEDVRAYFEANRARYETPERYQLWRILCRTRDEALGVLASIKADPSPKAFGDLAREHSQDKGTFLRSGDLGFVTEDGTSNEPGLRVDAAVVRAARTVADGALVPQPVAEGDLFAVVWRRGTIAATRRTADEVAPQIRDAITKARLKEETDKLLAGLRAAKVHDETDALLDTLDLSLPERGKD